LIVIGVDSHKQTHTAVAVDAVGRRLAERTVRANSDGHLQLVAWATGLRDGSTDTLEPAFAVEDCRHLTRRLEGDLLAAGLTVTRVPTRLMADARRGGRSPGKSDPIDAEAVAIAALRHPGLPTARLDGPAREVKLLCAHRADLVKQRTRVSARLRWYLHELDPDLQVPARGLRHHRHVQQVYSALETTPGVVARLARAQLDRLIELNAAITALDKELKVLVTAMAPALLKMPGCGVLSAAVIIGETAGVDRFRDKDAFARFTGTAPIPVWSGSSAGKACCLSRRRPKSATTPPSSRVRPREPRALLWTRTRPRREPSHPGLPPLGIPHVRPSERPVERFGRRAAAGSARAGHG